MRKPSGGKAQGGGGIEAEPGHPNVPRATMYWITDHFSFSVQLTEKE